MKKHVWLLALGLALAILVAGAGHSAFAQGPTTKWVDQVNGSDSNDGNTEAAAYATLQFAIDNSSSGLDDANRSIIYVKDGTYGGNQTGGCAGLNSGILIHSLDYLTIQAAPGDDPVVKPGTSGDITSISVDNSNHLIVDNIDSDQSVAKFDHWHICNSEDLTLRNSNFTGEGAEDGLDFETNHTTALVENNHFEYVGEDTLDFSDGAYADITIQDNLFEANNRRPLFIRNSGSQPIGGFVIRRNMSLGTNEQEAFRVIGADNVLIENNVIINSQQQAIYIDTNLSGGSPSSNVTIQHNSTFNSGEEEIRLKVTGADIVVKNNIFYANGTHAAISVPTGATQPLASEDHNLIFNDGPSTESSSSVQVTNFGSNTITGVDPLFVSTTAGSEDLSLQSGSPAIEAGTDLGVTDDIENTARPNPAGTNPDIGAYEVHFDEEGPITTDVLANPNPVEVDTGVLLTATVDDTTTGNSNIASANYEVRNSENVLIESGSMDADTTTAVIDGFDTPIEDVTASIGPFDSPAVLEVCVSGTDAAGNTGPEECILLAVFDPDAGFVTGGGWIDSPPGAIPQADGELSPFTQDELDNNWEADRQFPSDGVTSVTAFGRDNVARIGIDSAKTDSNTFLRTEGIKTLIDDFGDAVQVDLYIDPDWQDKAVRAGFWVVGDDGAGNRDNLFSIIEFVNNEPCPVEDCSNQSNITDHEGFRIWDSAVGWKENLDTPFSYGEWVTLRIELDPVAEQYEYYINGNSVGTATGGQNFIRELFLNSYNYGLDAFPNLNSDDYAAHWHAGGSSVIEGKANFGFVSKYKKGANVPEGNTQFVFKAGDLNFHSTSYDWLVVTGSNFAKFKGEGTVNGDVSPTGDPFKFQLWAGDGTGSNGEDTFRIKIWYEDSGNEVVVYDNGMNQPIDGGNIVVHSK